MASVTDIANRALQKLGAIKITSIDDDIKAAREAKRAFDIVRDAVFRDHPWNCLIARASLAALVDEPAWGFDYQYQLPSDCLRILDIDSSLEWRVEGRKLLTDEAAPLYVRYLKQETDPAQYDAMLVEALASRLAMELAEPLTQSNTKIELASRAYEDALKAARRRDAQEGSARQTFESSWLNSRF